MACDVKQGGCMPNMHEADCAADFDADKELARFLRDNAEELAMLLATTFDTEYPHSVKALPNEFWQDWACDELAYYAGQIESHTVDANHYLSFQDGDMVIQSDRQLKTIMLAMENLFFFGKVTMRELSVRFAAQSQERRALSAALERFIQMNARAWTEAFLNTACSPGALLGSWAFHATGAAAQPRQAREGSGVHAQDPDSGLPLDRLTEKERTIVDLVVRGLSNREIAARLNVTQGTVKNHIGHVFDKLGVASRTELAVRMLQKDAD